MTSGGRWPANVILSPGMAEALDDQSGDVKSAPYKQSTNKAGRTSMGGGAMHIAPGGYSDSGGASRFFLNAGYEQWELEWIYSVGLRPCGTEPQ